MQAMETVESLRRCYYRVRSTDALIEATWQVGMTQPDFVSLLQCCRALDTMREASNARFGKVLEAARGEAAGGGESDLRRLKRQFSSLKNTYMLYDTKEHFIDGAAAYTSSSNWFALA